MSESQSYNEIKSDIESASHTINQLFSVNMENFHLISRHRNGLFREQRPLGGFGTS